MALTADGTRAVVGSVGGTVAFFELRGAVWTPRGSWTDLRSPVRDLDVDAEGARVVVGLPEHQGRGTVVVLVRRGSRYEHEQLLAPDGSSDFGRSLAISADGSRLVLGAPRELDEGGRAVGAAYVFRRDGTAWVLEAHLTVPGAGARAELGRGVDIAPDGTWLVVGAPGARAGERRTTGAAFVFSRSPRGSWALEDTLAPDALTRGDRFGVSVAIDGASGDVVVGASTRDVGGQRDAGSAWVLRRAGPGWESVAVLAPRDPTARHVGSTVSIASGRVLVGSARGGVFVEDRAQAGAPRAVLEPIRAGESMFGADVALSADGRRALIGAPLDDPRGVLRAGSAQLFDVGPVAPGESPATSLSGPWVSLTTERTRRVAARESALAARLLAQAGVGVLLGALAVAGSHALLREIGPPRSCSTSRGFCLDLSPVHNFIALVTMAPNFVSLTILAIHGIGRALGGRGDRAATIVGALLGAAFGVGAIAGADQLGRPGGVATAEHEPLMVGGFALAATLVVAGALLGDSITDQLAASEEDEPDLVPLVHLSPEGGWLGIRGAL